MTVEQDVFGVTRDGQRVDRFTIATADGRQLRAITYGATITSLLLPDRSGHYADVVLGCDTLVDYEAQSAYLGAVIGRYANRIACARISIDGVQHQLTANEGPHHLHGGRRGFDAHVWKARSFQSDTAAGVRFSRVSACGEENYPGTLVSGVTYTLDVHGAVRIDYEATTTAPTVVNLTQHSYFDLSGGTSGDVLDHVLTIAAARYTPVDADLIPTGALAPVRDTPFDFRTPCPIGSRIDVDHAQLRYGLGYDHNWVLDSVASPHPVAAVYEPRSGRTLEIRTTEPGLQFYSGNRLAVRQAKGGREYRARNGFCLETQHFPDSPSHPHFPTTVVYPSHVMRSHTTWTFGTSCAQP